MNGPQAALIHKGRRLHLQHGPIDLIVHADGSTDQISHAYRQAQIAFADVLTSLVAELPMLRRAARASDPAPCRGPVARRMVHAVDGFASTDEAGFVTPMAAVAGAVADHVLQSMTQEAQLARGWVNNGGDIAWHLAPNQSLTTTIVQLPGHAGGTALRSGDMTLDWQMPVRGMATSGWRGRSHSLGIADSVTVLAIDAARADVAATLLANAVDLPGSDKVLRRPASELSDDSDLGDRLVTVDVQKLDPTEIERALCDAGHLADQWIAENRIDWAVIQLQGSMRIAGPFEMGEFNQNRVSCVNTQMNWQSHQTAQESSDALC